MTPDRMTAERIALAMRSDPQFRPPQHPRLVDGLVVVRLTDGVLIEGGAERQYLRGAASASLLPRLLGVLDGKRDIATLASAIGERAATVGKAIALLYACGLLEEGDADAAGVDPEIAAFLSRHVDTTRANANTAGASLRIANAVVSVSGPPDAADALIAELRRVGLGTVEHEAAFASGHADTVTLAVGLEAGGELQPLMRLDRDCAAAGVPWVRFAQSGTAIEIGPRFERSVSLCYACFAALHESPPAAPGSGAPYAFDFLLAHAAAEVTWLVARTCTALSPAGLTRIDLPDLTPERRAYPPRPGCASCGTGGPSLMPGVPVAYAYDRSVAFPPRHLLNVKDHQHHYRESNLALQSDAKDYPSATRVDLPGPHDETPPDGIFDGGLPQPAGRPGHLDIRTLSGLLARIAGVRGDGQGFPAIPGKVPRWAPSGGNLGSVGVYVLVRDLPGVVPGIWFYVPQVRQLQRIAPKRDAEDVARLLLDASRDALDPQTRVALVLAGALLRVARKYGTFAYRTVHLDAGCVLGQLHAVAAGYGLRVESASGWDDDALHDALGVNDFEPIVGLLGLCPSAHGGLRPVGEAAAPAQVGAAVGLVAGHDFEPTRIYRELLRRSRDPVLPPAREQYDAVPPAWRRAATEATLDIGAGGDAIEGVLRRRRSVRAYTQRPVEAGHLALALRAAWQAPIDRDSRAALEIGVLSRGVEGLDQGLWSLEGVDPVRLVLRNDLPSVPAAENIVLQREYAHAPALIIVLGSLRTMDLRAGAHGYRLLLRAATAVAQAAWLAALSVGVDGSIFAGLLPDAVDRLCGGGPYDRAQLIGLALGHGRPGP